MELDELAVSDGPLPPLQELAHRPSSWSFGNQIFLATDGLQGRSLRSLAFSSDAKADLDE
jgi:hypothetical protein